MTGRSERDPTAAPSATAPAAFFVIIRGPLGVGKTTVARRLARKLGGEHVLIDQILEDHALEEWKDGYISVGSFLRANQVAAVRAGPVLSRGVPVVFDGNFYWERQIQDLIGRLDHPHFVFTLHAPLATCIARDARRAVSYGAEAARDVCDKSSQFDWGVRVDAARTIDGTVGEILAQLPPARRCARGTASPVTRAEGSQRSSALRRRSTPRPSSAARR